MNKEQAWQFYSIWLTHHLLRGSEGRGEVSSIRSVVIDLPDEVISLVDTSDAEISLLRLCQRFEAAEVCLSLHNRKEWKNMFTYCFFLKIPQTFQERMMFKSNILRRLTPLARLFHSFMDRFLATSSLAPSDAEMGIAYHATASLFQVASALLFSPEGVFTQLFAFYILPPWRRLEKEAPSKRAILYNCIGENLHSVGIISHGK